MQVRRRSDRTIIIILALFFLPTVRSFLTDRKKLLSTLLVVGQQRASIKSIKIISQIIIHFQREPQYHAFMAFN